MKRSIIIAALALAAVTLPSANGARAGTPNECQQWAEFFHAGNDSAVMHEIGCDDGPEANGMYNRTPTPCASDARRYMRQGLMPGTYTFRVAVANGVTRCVFTEDGSWLPE